MKADVTKSLRNTLGKMEVALSTIKEAIVWTDLNGVIQWCNAPFDKIIGKQHIFTLGSNILEVLPLLSEEGEKLNEGSHPVSVVMETKSFCDGYYQFIQSEKQLTFFLSATYCEISEHDRSVVVGIQDITKRRELRDEKELAERAKHIVEEKLRIQTEFTSTVSHELRTPLASIKSSVDIMDSGRAGNLTDDQKIFLGKVKSNVDRLNRLIDDILDLSKMESGIIEINIQQQDVNKIMQDVIEMQELVAKEKGLVIERQWEALPRMSVDGDKLIQVFNNLIGNAIKFTEEGKIIISAKSYQENNYVEFCIADTGVGIKIEDQDKLFEKFQQIGNVIQSVDGTGLGLAICKEIVSHHGGRIWAESKLGKGSHFKFILPIDERRQGNEPK